MENLVKQGRVSWGARVEAGRLAIRRNRSPARDDGDLDWGGSSRIEDCGQVMHIIQGKSQQNL